MKQFLLVLVLANTACVHLRFVGLYKDLYIESQNKYRETIQCNPPMVVTFDENMSEQEIKITREALALWETNAGSPLFIDIGVSPAFNQFDSIHVRNIRSGEQTSDDWGAFTSVSISAESACIAHAEIVYAYPLGSFNDWTARKVAQHEIGHALGFDESTHKNHVMYKSTDNLRDTFIMADSEIKELRRIYHGDQE